MIDNENYIISRERYREVMDILKEILEATKGINTHQTKQRPLKRP